MAGRGLKRPQPRVQRAIAAGVKLITNNPADFSLYLDDGLAVENWGS